MPKRPATPLEALVPDIAMGIRAAIATLLPFYFASASAIPALSWTALGGWFGTSADPGGSRATRFRVLLFFVISGSACVALAETLTARSSLLAVATVAAVAFGGSLLGMISGSMSTLGTNLAIIAAVGSARTSPTPARDSLFFAVGATWATMLSTVVWPVWTHLPVRRTVGAVYAELAAYAANLIECIDQQLPHFDPRFREIAHLDRRRIRDAVEKARKMTVAIRTRHEGESRLGSNLRVLLGLAEAQVPLLVTLADDLEALAPKERGPIAEVLARVHRESTEVQRELFTRVIASPGRNRRAPHPEAPTTPASNHPVDHLITRLSHASELAVTFAFALDTFDTFEKIETPALRPFLDTKKAFVDALIRLREVASPSSPSFRHALRAAGAVCFAAILGRWISPTHSQWVIVSTFAVLKPYPGATWNRAAERVLGTVLGSMVAVVALTTIHSPALLMIVMAPMCVAAVATRPRSYRLFTFFLTPVFVVTATHTPGDWHAAAARAGDALAGGAIAIIAALAIFPSWEYSRLADALATMFEAMSRYAHVVLDEFGRPRNRTATRSADVQAQYRSASIAVSKAEASLDRMLAEPTHKSPEDAEAMQLVTYTRRLAGALMALETYADASPHHAGINQGTSSIESMAPIAPLAPIAKYVVGVLARAERFAADGKREPNEGVPVAPTSLDPHLRALVERVLAHAGLLATVIAYDADGETEPLSR
jgi:uncharacterized membrane protein YccC